MPVVAAVYIFFDIVDHVFARGPEYFVFVHKQTSKSRLKFGKARFVHWALGLLVSIYEINYFILINLRP